MPARIKRDLSGLCGISKLLAPSIKSSAMLHSSDA
ncbi:hypothetical protein Hamer_G006801, partial [Homarus americanus]